MIDARRVALADISAGEIVAESRGTVEVDVAQLVACPVGCEMGKYPDAARGAGRDGDLGGTEERNVTQADGAGRACGVCDSCRLRAEGFAAAGVADPTPYRV